MKVLQINIFGNLSTGKIAVDLYRVLTAAGHEGKVAYARGNIEAGVPSITIGNRMDVYLHGVLTRLTDRAGFYSGQATRRLLEEIRVYDPDIIHLHNLHGYYLNIELLFEYLREWDRPVVWTLHDCWAFTGHCCHYSVARCDKWKNGCENCPQKSSYPASYVDNSKVNYRKKQELFTSLPKLHLVAVSKWLKKQVEQSYLQNLPCEVIYNGIDRQRFRPMKSDFRRKHDLENCFLILGVASTWSVHKGLEDFIRLSDMLEADCRIVLVGINSRQKKRLPDKIIALERTNSAEELAQIYSSADVFFNASREETFGLPTVEAIACHTPAIVYGATALPEVITAENGIVIKTGDVEAVKSAIEAIRKGERKFAFGDFQYDKYTQYQRYIRLYERICKEKDVKTQ